MRRQWKSERTENNETARSFWNSVAGYYEGRELPVWTEDPFLRLMADKVPFSPDMKSLDIGCGAGDYSILLAEKVKLATGIDLSPAMVEAAREKAAARAVRNVEFACADWDLLDSKAAGWNRAFDLVFAHMSPAIDSAAALEKMMACSRQHCFLTKPTRRKDSVLDPIKALLGLVPGSAFDKHIGTAFDLVWQRGSCPEFYYWQDQWSFEHSLEEACAWYSAKIKTWRVVGSEEARVIREYLETIAVDGRVREETSTTIVTMYWQV